jgi:subtilisin family serine protease
MTDALPRVFGDSQLATLDYVEHIGLNYTVQYPEPVSLISAEKAQLTSPWWADGTPTTAGVAYAADAPQEDLTTVADLCEASERSEDGSSASVAVLDTGCNYVQEIHGDAIVDGKNLLTGATIDPSADDYAAIEDGDGHGSWCTGAVHDLAPGADLLVGKVLADDGSGQTATILDGLDWAVDAGADVINLSLGSPFYSSALARTVAEIVQDDDVLVVVAAGNSRQTTRWLSTPADTTHAVAVAATNAVSVDEMESAYFSCVGPDSGLGDKSEGETRGREVTVAAPGMEIVAPTSSGDVALSGTSMASPVVAAMAGIVRGATYVAAEDLQDQLQSTATRLPRAAASEVGGGLVNLSRLLDGVDADETQADVQDDTADGREAFNRSASGDYRWIRSQVGGTF